MTHIVWTEARCDGGSGDSTDRAAPHSGQGATGLTLAPTPRTSGRGSPRSGQTNGNCKDNPSGSIASERERERERRTVEVGEREEERETERARKGKRARRQIQGRPYFTQFRM